MRIPRIFHDQPLKGRDRVILPPKAARHVVTVLRLKDEAPVVLIDGSGFEFEGILEKADQKHACVHIVRMHGPAVESPLQVTLAQAISRGERMDYTVQKAVELGVAAIVPLLTERSVVRLDTKSAVRKRQHWQEIAINACEQSGRVQVPEVRPVVALHVFLTALPHAPLKLVLDPQAEMQVGRLTKPINRSVLLLVGPEGGLADPERSAAIHAGFVGLQLGPRVLRTETAALVALSLLQARWGDLGGL